MNRIKWGKTQGVYRSSYIPISHLAASHVAKISRPRKVGQVRDFFGVGRSKETDSSRMPDVTLTFGHGFSMN